MKIGEILEALKVEGVKVSDVAKTIKGISEKPLRKALKDAGYHFSNSGVKGWHYIGEGDEPLDKSIFDYAKKRERKATVKADASMVKAKANSEITSASKETAVATDIEAPTSKTDASTSELKASNSELKASTSGLDAIDMHLQKKASESKDRTYRGFYLDNDLLTIIDTVARGSKSDLINDVIRKVFREKGLL